MAQSLRLDVALFSQGLASSRSRAGGLIDEGHVFVNGVCCKKPSCKVSPTDVLEVRGGQCFVSRGGYKLLKAMETFALDLDDCVCMDVGASTGGFTDCMLQHGAKRVYAVDVGTDQLAQSLREDPRVICKEQCNFRYATKEDIPDAIDFASVDVSFISLDKILPPLYNLLSETGAAVCLIKPQFEAGKENLSKNGVVRSPAVHRQVIERVMKESIATGFSVLGLTYSPIKGPQGNIEYLLHLGVNVQQDIMQMQPKTIETVVLEAHKELGDKE